jgi:MFS family permease
LSEEQGGGVVKSEGADGEPGQGSELARNWRTLLAASLGIGLGVSGLLTYTAGLFASELGRDVGLSRTAFGAAVFGSTLSLAIAMPVVGRVVDRFGPKAAAIAGALLLAAGFVGMATLVHSPLAYILLMLLIGLTAGTCSPVPFTRAVTGAFHRSRGLALGLTQVGIGVAAAIVPPAVAVIIARYDWHAGFLFLAVLALLGVLPAWWGLPGRATAARQVAAPAAPGLGRSMLFRVQMAAFATMAFAFAGLLSHFVPMLREAGLSGQRAGTLAGLIGVSVIVTRVIVGWLADRIEPAWLGAASCALCAAGCVTLGLGGVPLAPIGALALGAAMGAEADLIGILTARYFGTAAYSRLYSLQYAAFMVAGGVSPMWIGLLADRAGGYRSALLVAGGLLLVPILLFLWLPRIERRAA